MTKWKFEKTPGMTYDEWLDSDNAMMDSGSFGLTGAAIMRAMHPKKFKAFFKEWVRTFDPNNCEDDGEDEFDRKTGKYKVPKPTMRRFMDEWANGDAEYWEVEESPSALAKALFPDTYAALKEAYEEGAKMAPEDYENAKESENPARQKG